MKLFDNGIYHHYIKAPRIILDINTTITKMIMPSNVIFFLNNFTVGKILCVILKNIEFEHFVVANTRQLNN